MKKLAFISDTHGKHHEIKIDPCDILFHSGDISNIGAAMEIADFINWFKEQPAKNKVFIAGNHDRGLDWNYTQTRKYPVEKLLAEQNYFDIQEQLKYLPSDVHYLQDEELKISGIKIYGSPFSPSFHRHNWAFNADRGREIRNIWRQIPDDINILLTHSPCKNILDRIPPSFIKKGETENVGCMDLQLRLRQLKNLKIHSSGHIHDNFGIKEKLGVKYINAAVLDNNYEALTNKPIYIDYE